MMIPWIEQKTNGILIRLQIQPKASRTEVVGLYGDPPRLKIRIAAPAVENKANEVLINFLSDILDLPFSQIQMVRGLTSKKKDLFLPHISIEAVSAKILGKCSLN